MPNKNMSAPRLLRMVLEFRHMPYCPNVKTILPVNECKCWLNAVARWATGTKLTGKKLDNGTVQFLVGSRKTKSKKYHHTLVNCGSRNRHNNTYDLGDVTCGHCKKLASAGKMAAPPGPIPGPNGQGFIKFGSSSDDARTGLLRLLDRRAHS